MNKKSTLDKLKDSLVPSLFAGIASAGIYYFIIDSDLLEPAPFLGIQVPTGVAVVASGAIGNMIGELATEFVLPLIPGNSSFQSIENKVLPPVLAGLAAFGANKLLISDQSNFQSSFIIGAGGSVIGKYAYGSVYGSN